MATPEQFVERAPQWVRHGLYAMPMGITGVGTSLDSNLSIAPDRGKPFAFHFVLGSPQHIAEFKDAWDYAEDSKLGDLLGYPSCCRDFYKRVWVEDGLVDMTWPMAAATASPDVEGTSIQIDSQPKANTLWRCLGVRAVPHLPCSFNCNATIELANRFIQVGREHQFAEEMDWLLQVLDWPVEWSALHGISEIKTPILKVSTQTDATACKYTVRYNGLSTPIERAHGLSFPFLAPSLPILTGSRGFKKGLANAIVQHSPIAEWHASDNGFSTVAAMNKAHEPIVKAADACLTEHSGSVLDLGCGNGAMLQKLLKLHPSIVPYGVDIEADRISHARELMPHLADNFVVGDILNIESIWSAEDHEDQRYALVLVMPGRFIEADPGKAELLMTRIRSRCDRILLYAYGDWLRRYGTLKNLAEAAGFVTAVGQDTDEGVGAALAMVIGGDA